MKSFLHHLLFISLLGCYIFIGVIAYWEFYPYKVIQFKTNTLPLTSHELKIGDPIPIKFNYCKYINTQAHILVNLENNVFYQLPSYDSNSVPSCYSRITKMFIVPPVLTLGDEARVHFTFIYQVNPIRQITYSIYTEEFKVIK